jgi:type II secretion system protein I
MSRRAFVLLEVLVSLTILTVAVTAVLRSFSQSLRAVKMIEVETQAVFFAQQLLDEFEINPPEEGDHEGGFGDAYKNYFYRATVEYEEPDYDEDNLHEEVAQFYPLRRLKIEIFYDNGISKPLRAANLETAIMGFERFSHEAKQQMALY